MKAVIFDLDDTLISEKDYVMSGYRAVAEYLSEGRGLDRSEVFNVLKEKFASSAKNVFNRMYDQLGISYEEEDIKELVNVYREHRPDISFCDDAEGCLEILKGSGYLLGVLTDGYAVTQKRKAEALRLDERFDEIVFTDELGREYWKPSARGFELIGRKHGIDYKDMVYIGDNPKKDFEIKKEAPIKTVRIIRPDGVYRNEPYAGEYREDRRISSLSELDAVLKELLK